MRLLAIRDLSFVHRRNAPDNCDHQQGRYFDIIAH